MRADSSNVPPAAGSTSMGPAVSSPSYHGRDKAARSNVPDGDLAHGGSSIIRPQSRADVAQAGSVSIGMAAQEGSAPSATAQAGAVPKGAAAQPGGRGRRLLAATARAEAPAEGCGRWGVEAHCAQLGEGPGASGTVGTRE